MVKLTIGNHLYMLYAFFIVPYSVGNALASSTVSTFLTVSSNRISDPHPNLIKKANQGHLSRNIGNTMFTNKHTKRIMCKIDQYLIQKRLINPMKCIKNTGFSPQAIVVLYAIVASISMDDHTFNLYVDSLNYVALEFSSVGHEKNCHPCYKFTNIFKVHCHCTDK